jgi:hypothetical protein
MVPFRFTLGKKKALGPWPMGFCHGLIKKSEVIQSAMCSLLWSHSGVAYTKNKGL